MNTNNAILRRKQAGVSTRRPSAKRRRMPPQYYDEPLNAAIWFAVRGFRTVYGAGFANIRYLQVPGHRVTSVECTDAEQKHVYTVSTATAVRLDELANAGTKKGHDAAEDKGHFIVA